VRAIQVTCPHCGARLGAGTAEVVTCEYCGTESRVQRRTGVLERVMPPPAATNLPVQIAVQTRSTFTLMIILVSVIVPIVITTIVIFSVVRETRRVTNTLSHLPKPTTAKPPTYVKPEDRPPSWQGTDGVLLVDVNHDGTPDLVGRGRQVARGDIIRVIALDGVTGKMVWQSEPVGTYTQTYQAPLALAGDLVVMANDAGAVQAFAVASGAKVWSTTTPERVTTFCSGEGDAIVALGADQMLRPLARKDGALGTATRTPGKPDPFRRKAPCTQLPSDDESPFLRSKNAGVDQKLQQKLGVWAVAIVESTGGRVMGAAKSSGTRVTTLISLDDKNAEKWRITASKQPLTTDGAPIYMAIGDSQVCVVYNVSGHYRVGCYALADGAQLWDRDAPPFINGLAVAGSSLVMTTHRGLEVHDISTGAQRWQME